MQDINQYRILIVDDSKINIDILVEALKKNYRLGAAINGHKALEYAKTNQPDLILLDILMPGMDGFEVCRKLKEDQKTKDIPVIFITAIDGTNNKKKGFEIGAIDYITKPFEIAEVKARVKTHLTLRNTQKEIQNQNIQLEEKINERTEQLTRANGQIQQVQKMQALGTLSGGIAHDFNNILSAIIGYSELSMYDAPEGSPVPKRMERILQACQRAKELVEQILTLSRLNKTELQPVQPHLIVKEVLKLLEATLPATIEIRKKINSNSYTIMANSIQVHQILMNLCTNASHAMRGKKIGILDVSLDTLLVDENSIGKKLNLKPGQYIRIVVGDTGHGMDKGTMARIFDPYFTTKEKGEGTGLGLSVVQGIVENYSGAINVYSEAGQGTTFQIFLPLIGTNLPFINKDRPPMPTGDERILLVDDEKLLVESCREILVKIGYDVVPKNSSLAALDDFRNNPEKFDLVITDMTMPKMTGVDLVREIKNIRSDIPVIICTGFSELITAEIAKNLGVNKLLMKPFFSNELAAVIREVLDSEKIQEEGQAKENE